MAAPNAPTPVSFNPVELANKVMTTISNTAKSVSKSNDDTIKEIVNSFTSYLNKKDQKDETKSGDKPKSSLVPVVYKQESKQIEQFDTIKDVLKKLIDYI